MNTTAVVQRRVGKRVRLKNFLKRRTKDLIVRMVVLNYEAQLFGARAHSDRKEIIMTTHNVAPCETLIETKTVLRYDLDARRYRQGRELFRAGDSLEIEVAPNVWLPVNIESGSSHTDDGWIFTTTDGLTILPKEGLAVRHHTVVHKFY